MSHLVNNQLLQKMEGIKTGKVDFDGTVVDSYEDWENCNFRFPTYRVEILKKFAQDKEDKRDVDIVKFYGVPYERHTFTEGNNDFITNIEVEDSIFANQKPDKNMWNKGGRCTLTVDAKNGVKFNKKTIPNPNNVIKQERIADVQAGDIVQVFLGYKRKTNPDVIGLPEPTKRNVIEYTVFIGTIGSIKYYHNNAGEYAYIRCHSFENLCNFVRFSKNFFTPKTDTEYGVNENNAQSGGNNTLEVEVTMFKTKDALQSIHDLVAATIHTHTTMFDITNKINIPGFMYKDVIKKYVSNANLWETLKSFPKNYIDRSGLGDNFIVSYIEKICDEKTKLITKLEIRTEFAYLMDRDKGVYYQFREQVEVIDCVVGNLDVFNKSIKNGNDGFWNKLNDFFMSNVLKINTLDNLSNVFNSIILYTGTSVITFPFKLDNVKKILKEQSKAYTLIMEGLNKQNPALRLKELEITDSNYEYVKELAIESIKEHGIRPLFLNSEAFELLTDIKLYDPNDTKELKELLTLILKETVKKKDKGTVSLIGDPRINFYKTAILIRMLSKVMAKDFANAFELVPRKVRIYERTRRIKRFHVIQKGKLQKKREYYTTYNFPNGYFFPVTFKHTFTRDEGFRTEISYHEDRDSLAKRYSNLIDPLMMNLSYANLTFDRDQALIYQIIKDETEGVRLFNADINYEEVIHAPRKGRVYNLKQLSLDKQLDMEDKKLFREEAKEHDRLIDKKKKKRPKYPSEMIKSLTARPYGFPEEEEETENVLMRPSRMGLYNLPTQEWLDDYPPTEELEFKQPSDFTKSKFKNVDAQGTPYINDLSSWAFMSGGQLMDALKTPTELKRQKYNINRDLRQFYSEPVVYKINKSTAENGEQIFNLEKIDYKTREGMRRIDKLERNPETKGKTSYLMTYEDIVKGAFGEFTQRRKNISPDAVVKLNREKTLKGEIPDATEIGHRSDTYEEYKDIMDRWQVGYNAGIGAGKSSLTIDKPTLMKIITETGKESIEGLAMGHIVPLMVSGGHRLTFPVLKKNWAKAVQTAKERYEMELDEEMEDID